MQVAGGWLYLFPSGMGTSSMLEVVQKLRPRLRYAFRQPPLATAPPDIAMADIDTPDPTFTIASTDADSVYDQPPTTNDLLYDQHQILSDSSRRFCNHRRPLQLLTQHIYGYLPNGNEKKKKIEKIEKIKRTNTHFILSPSHCSHRHKLPIDSSSASNFSRCPPNSVSFSCTHPPFKLYPPPLFLRSKHVQICPIVLRAFAFAQQPMHDHRRRFHGSYIRSHPRHQSVEPFQIMPCPLSPCMPCTSPHILPTTVVSSFNHMLLILYRSPSFASWRPRSLFLLSFFPVRAPL